MKFEFNNNTSGSGQIIIYDPDTYTGSKYKRGQLILYNNLLWVVTQDFTATVWEDDIAAGYLEMVGADGVSKFFSSLVIDNSFGEGDTVSNILLSTLTFISGNHTDAKAGDEVNFPNDYAGIITAVHADTQSFDVILIKHDTAVLWGNIGGNITNQTDLSELLGNFVHKTGDEIIDGTKTFSASPQVIDPVNPLDAVNYRTLQTLVNQMKFRVDLVEALPQTGEEGVIYVVQEYHIQNLRYYRTNSVVTGGAPVSGGAGFISNSDTIGDANLYIPGTDNLFFWSKDRFQSTEFKTRASVGLPSGRAGFCTTGDGKYGVCAIANNALYKMTNADSPTFALLQSGIGDATPTAILDNETRAVFMLWIQNSANLGIITIDKTKAANDSACYSYQQLTKPAGFNTKTFNARKESIYNPATRQTQDIIQMVNYSETSLIWFFVSDYNNFAAWHKINLNGFYTNGNNSVTFVGIIASHDSDDIIFHTNYSNGLADNNKFIRTNYATFTTATSVSNFTVTAKALVNTATNAFHFPKNAGEFFRHPSTNHLLLPVYNNASAQPKIWYWDVETNSVYEYALDGNVAGALMLYYKNEHAVIAWKSNNTFDLLDDFGNVIKKVDSLPLTVFTSIFKLNLGGLPVLMSAGATTPDMRLNIAFPTFADPYSREYIWSDVTRQYHEFGDLQVPIENYVTQQEFYQALANLQTGDVTQQQLNQAIAQEAINRNTAIANAISDARSKNAFPELAWFNPADVTQMGWKKEWGGWQTGYFVITSSAAAKTANIPLFNNDQCLIEIVPHFQNYYQVRIWHVEGGWRQSTVRWEKIFRADGASDDNWTLRGEQQISTTGGDNHTLGAPFGNITVIHDASSFRITHAMYNTITRRAISGVRAGYLFKNSVTAAGATSVFSRKIDTTDALNATVAVPASSDAGRISGYASFTCTGGANPAQTPSGEPVGGNRPVLPVLFHYEYDYEYGMGATGGGDAISGAWGVFKISYLSDFKSQQE